MVIGRFKPGGWMVFPFLLFALLTIGTMHHLVVKKPLSAEAAALKKIAMPLREYARKKGLDEQVFFLVNMAIPSGKNRFFVYDLDRDSVWMRGLVAHGRGNGAWQGEPEFSNVKGSGCTSLGKYKIGGSYKGVFGLAYKLHGLDSSNSNAYARYVVLHAHNLVPQTEVFPLPICQSLGCPMVSEDFLSQLQKVLRSRSQPMLLYIYK
jgi:L,D-transpeptidase catalytic domain